MNGPQPKQNFAVLAIVSLTVGLSLFALGLFGRSRQPLRVAC